MGKFSNFICAAVTVISIGLCFTSANADDGRVVLTIDGEIAGSTPRNFTLEQLEAIGMETIKTATPWHEGEQTFEGVPLAALMQHVGANGDIAYVLALNNYSTEVPITDFEEHGVILASRKGGEAMSVAEKGPLFIIYPYDSDPALRTELYYTRSAWQVRQITIE
ncbi:oxidoreductase [Maritalea mediterranea]|uniref:Oxidoreductase n=1 Tax=Maritalea mediterranea TaxID=2909667 RepID=A0ABS9E853_9HYPH|nr:oxidoreductase [Maritalea mediterranea]MCF4098364.1 oxidoreductase [Maritalea mediterranea]